MRAVGIDPSRLPEQGETPSGLTPAAAAIFAETVQQRRDELHGMPPEEAWLEALEETSMRAFADGDDMWKQSLWGRTRRNETRAHFMRLRQRLVTAIDRTEILRGADFMHVAHHSSLAKGRLEIVSEGLMRFRDRRRLARFDAKVEDSGAFRERNRVRYFDRPAYPTFELREAFTRRLLTITYDLPSRWIPWDVLPEPLFDGGAYRRAIRESIAEPVIMRHRFQGTIWRKLI